MTQLIRHRQRVSQAVSRPGSFIVPNRRATEVLAAVFTLGTGATSLGSGQYRLTGPDAYMNIGLDNAAINKWQAVGGKFALYFETVNFFEDGELFDTPKGVQVYETEFNISPNPIPNGYVRATGGIVSSQNNELHGNVRYRDVRANAVNLNKLFEIGFGSTAGVTDYETFGNFKLERYLG